MIPNRHIINRKHEATPEMYTHQCEDYERCESMELNNELRDLIERNASSDPKAATPAATYSPRISCSPKAPGQTASMSSKGTVGRKTTASSPEHTEHDQSRRKNVINSLEQRIQCLERQRKELLEVNQQWDQQFRNMKELYERKVAELKRRLTSTGVPSTLEKEPEQSHSRGDQQHEPLHSALAEKKSLSEELKELKKENTLLKDKSTLTNKKMEHYKCEIKRLNKALEDALTMERSSLSTEEGKCKGECGHAETRAEVEILRQQLQIYEEDFRKERSDRERLNQEKEELKKINQSSQSQLNRLSSQIKACQIEKEKLGKQLKQMYLPTCNCDLAFHLPDPWVPIVPELAQHPQEHPPDSQWYASDQFPLHMEPKAHEKKVNQ